MLLQNTLQNRTGTRSEKSKDATPSTPFLKQISSSHRATTHCEKTATAAFPGEGLKQYTVVPGGKELGTTSV